MNDPFVFLSHSSKDKQFVRKLDSSLTGSGIRTFLDERDIKLGDSIPKRVYDALGAATDVIYVISRNALTSKWVEEELGVAKMRQRQDHGIRVLPVLIDDAELPFTVAHVKCLIVRNWMEPEAFSAGLQEILETLGCSLVIPTSTDLQFYRDHFSLLGDLEFKLTALAGYASAAQLSANFTFGSDIKGKHCMQWLLYKYSDDDTEVPLEEASLFIERCRQRGMPDTSKAGCAAKLAAALLPHLNLSHKNVESMPLLHGCLNLAASLRELRTEFAATAAARFSTSAK